jgi:hypothetical protein
MPQSVDILAETVASGCGVSIDRAALQQFVAGDVLDGPKAPGWFVDFFNNVIKRRGGEYAIPVNDWPELINALLWLNDKYELDFDYDGESLMWRLPQLKVMLEVNVLEENNAAYPARVFVVS